MDTGRKGSLISVSDGESSAYAMFPLQARGIWFIQPKTTGKRMYFHLNNHLMSFLASLRWHGGR